MTKIDGSAYTEARAHGLSESEAFRVARESYFMKKFGTLPREGIGFDDYVNDPYDPDPLPDYHDSRFLGLGATAPSTEVATTSSGPRWSTSASDGCGHATCGFGSVLLLFALVFFLTSPMWARAVGGWEVALLGIGVVALVGFLLVFARHLTEGR